MSVKFDKSAAKEQPRQQEQEPESLLLVLAPQHLQRWFGGGQLYVRGTVYRFPMADARRMLSQTLESGLPVFRVFETPKQERVVPREPQGPVIEDRVAVVVKEAEVKPAALPKPETKIEIPDDDPELKARLDGIDKKIVEV